MLSPFYIASLLILSIAAIIILSVRFKFNTFFVLLIVAGTVGLAAGFEGEKVISLLKVGFGVTLEKVGLLIIFGTTLGVLLEKSNATLSLANFILSKTGENNAPLAVTLMGFLIGLPIFCDSGFVVLIGLVMSLVQRLPKSYITLIICLASSLLSVHCLVPPHPGITAAAGLLKVDIGQAMLLGTVLSIPPTIVAFFWAKYINQKLGLVFTQNTDSPIIETKNLPSPTASFLPIIVPIFLIALKSILLLNPQILPPTLLSILKFIGDPIVALLIGILLAFPLFQKSETRAFHALFDAAIDKSGPILAVIAAGGAFGEIIKALDLGKVFGSSLAASGLGLAIPFALAAIFKIAQGSSTVAVISTASIIAPLLPSIGLDTEGGHLLALMSAGSGSLFFSHTNDAYFWVISRFSKLDVATTLRAHTMASAFMAVVAFLSVWIASFVIK